MAQNSEIALRTRSRPQFGQGIGASASDIARSASNRVSQSRQTYSYSGILGLHSNIRTHSSYSTPVCADGKLLSRGGGILVGARTAKGWLGISDAPLSPSLPAALRRRARRWLYLILDDDPHVDRQGPRPVRGNDQRIEIHFRYLR
jgi:hypothetical protein